MKVVIVYISLKSIIRASFGYYPSNPGVDLIGLYKNPTTNLPQWEIYSKF